MKRLPTTISDLARVHDAGDGWHDPLPTLYSALSVIHDKAASLREHKELFVSMAGDISWDGQPIDGMSEADAALLPVPARRVLIPRDPGLWPRIGPNRRPEPPAPAAAAAPASPRPRRASRKRRTCRRCRRHRIAATSVSGVPTIAIRIAVPSTAPNWRNADETALAEPKRSARDLADGGRAEGREREADPGAGQQRCPGARSRASRARLRRCAAPAARRRTRCSRARSPRGGRSGRQAGRPGRRRSRSSAGRGSSAKPAVITL